MEFTCGSNYAIGMVQSLDLSIGYSSQSDLNKNVWHNPVGELTALHRV